MGAVIVTTSSLIYVVLKMAWGECKARMRRQKPNAGIGVVVAGARNNDRQPLTPSHRIGFGSFRARITELTNVQKVNHDNSGSTPNAPQDVIKS